MQQFRLENNLPEGTELYLDGPYLRLDTTPICAWPETAKAGLGVSLTSYTYQVNVKKKIYPFADDSGKDLLEVFGKNTFESLIFKPMCQNIGDDEPWPEGTHKYLRLVG